MLAVRLSLAGGAEADGDAKCGRGLVGGRGDQALEGRLSQVKHVRRPARRRQAVDGDDRPTRFPIESGVQMSQHLHVGGRLKIFLFAKPLTFAKRRGPVARDDGL